MIDPTCGSGHFLLGGFARLVNEWQRNEPGRNARDIAQKALDAVAGVDLNPFAVAISRFRLLVAALQVAGVRRLADAPDFTVHVAIGDSLLHGMRFGLSATQDLLGHDQYHDTGLEHAYASEDLAQVQQILGRQYHAVVGNPPYIVVKDSALNAAYRGRYASCHRQYSLGCPFTERFFQLAVTGARFGQAGFVGLITANSFMKREFGSKLIEDVLPRLDLTHVIDTSGAYIPGHGTPTIILLGCHRPPHNDLHSPSNTVRAVMGIKGEPSTPEDPANGLVWSAITRQIDEAISESEFVSTADVPRATLSVHPWSIGGGGASNAKTILERNGTTTLRQLGAEIGYGAVTRENDAYLIGSRALHRAGIDIKFIKQVVDGESVRDWSVADTFEALWPYEEHTLEAQASLSIRQLLWAYRTGLSGRVAYGKTQLERGLEWFEYSMFFKNRYSVPLSISFAFVATHNHFVFDRGGKVFIQSAPVIKMPEGTSEEVHLGLLGLLNSSAGCFWCQQVMHNKGGPGGGSSKDEKWHDFFEFASTALAEFPVVASFPVDIARRLDDLAGQLSAVRPTARLARDSISGSLPHRPALDADRMMAAALRHQMVAWQEELDWHVYGLYGLLPDGMDVSAVTHPAPPEVKLGQRAFEIVLARRMAAGEIETRWFEWLGIEPVREIPANWPSEYQRVVQRRIDLIERDRNLALLESMNCKRRWEQTPWIDLERTGLRSWLLDRLEQPAFWPANEGTPPQLTSTAKLAERAQADADFMHVAALYAGHADFDAAQLVAELVASEAVPLLTVTSR